jgi:hypothetical protein
MGVGSVNGPVHSCAFEPRADGYLASGLHNAGGSAQALGVELWVAHTVSVGLEIVKAAAGFLGARDLARMAWSSAWNFPVSSSSFLRSVHCVARGWVRPYRAFPRSLKCCLAW